MEEDFLTLAAQEREKQGPWEVELSYAEADLHRHKIKCDKNPGHLKFTPANEFSIDHLPPAYQDENILQYIKVLCDLTVRISVNYYSDGRLQSPPGSNFPTYRGCPRNILRVGSGWVSKVQTFPDVHEPSTVCTCKECTHSLRKTRKFAYIYINTAAHVIFNREEGEHTSCHLFFDYGSRLDECSNVVTLKEMSDVEANGSKDRSRMLYITHDMSLAERLKEILLKQRKLHESLRRKYRDKHTLTIITSHPHGCSKQVSVGHYLSLNYVSEYWTEYRYNTATCPGSSGARVYVLGRELWMGDHAHSAKCPGEKNLNYSADGVDSKLSSASCFLSKLSVSSRNMKVKLPQ